MLTSHPCIYYYHPYYIILSCGLHFCITSEILPVTVRKAVLEVELVQALVAWQT